MDSLWRAFGLKSKTENDTDEKNSDDETLYEKREEELYAVENREGRLIDCPFTDDEIGRELCRLWNHYQENYSNYAKKTNNLQRQDSNEDEGLFSNEPSDPVDSSAKAFLFIEYEDNDSTLNEFQESTR